MLENFLEFYRKSDGAAKKKIPGCIFAEKLVLEKGKVGGKDRRPKSEVFKTARPQDKKCEFECESEKTERECSLPSRKT